MSLLKFEKDTWGGAEVTDPVCSRAATGVEEVELFSARLRHSLQHWREKNYKGIWLTLQRPALALLSKAAESGFRPHHVTQEGSVVLNIWLRPGESRLPPGPSHFIGVAGFVLDRSARKLLVVQEKSGPASGVGLWKLPGGLADRFEGIAEAAMREVKEETGVQTDFVSLSSFLEFHSKHKRAGPSRRGTTDLYAICVLTPLSKETRAQASEISDCKWMDVDKVLNLPFYRSGAFGAAFRHALDVAEGRSSGLDRSVLPFGYRRGSCSVYHAAQPNKKSKL